MQAWVNYKRRIRRVTECNQASSPDAGYDSSSRAILVSDVELFQFLATAVTDRAANSLLGKTGVVTGQLGLQSSAPGG